MNRTYYANLVKVFYFNATTKFQDYKDSEPIEHTDSFCTYVMGRKIVVAEHTLDFVLDFDIC